MEQYDWLTNVFLTGKGLHYGQDFCGRELQAWMRKKNMDANTTTFFARGALQNSSFIGNLKPSYIELDLRRTP